MFTGHIDEIGVIEHADDRRVLIRAAKAGRHPTICVNGVALAVRPAGEDGVVAADLSPETRRRTTFDRIEPGTPVNVETPLAVGDALSGHLVQGDVDAVGKVVRVDDEHPARRVWIKIPDRYVRLVVPKGQIAVNGVSVTVAEVARDRFSVALIPLTLSSTTIGDLAVGDRVNLESDLVTRITRRSPAGAGAVVRDLVAALPWAGHVSGAQGVQKVIAQIAAGGAVLIWDPDREAEGDVIFAGSRLRPEDFVFLLTQAYGYPCVPCAPEVLERLEIEALHGAGDRHGTAFHTPVDLAAGTGTGVSAAERAATVRRLAHPDARPGDFTAPGHVIPIAARPGRLAERRGHTEATVAMCEAAGLPPVGVCCEIMNQDGTMATAADLEIAALRWGLPLLDIDDLRTWL
ncbi:riboflavin synthase [Nonomuraea zeae]|uniref:3,4-dihydroxy-2-butanone-4-phosphate synthase n=1 Tax=Nonomuraea zeae TaxID=1642303 RepID=A0A5S4GAX6_9ACTN|nr:riboflavin synthase [Nonomuraea zeae]TMR30022.1 riboflavin synthase [Nonomuraea zeae]